MEPETILIVGTSAGSASELAAAVPASPRLTTLSVASVDAALQRIADASTVLCDARDLAAADVERLITACSRAARPVPVLVALAHPSVDETVAWMRRGAYAVVSVDSGADSAGMQIEHALRHRELSLRNAELERSLEVHERLAMIGKLAAGVAHELNNPLDGVLRYVNLAVDRLPKESPQVTYLLEARRGLRRMADIVRDLLQFSRNASVESTDEDAERLARDAVLQVVQAHAGDRRIAASFEFPDTGMSLPRGMFQVFGNLARNAVDAMPHGGTLRVHASVASGRVRIEVSDTGTGIPDEIRDRIFEPFFTTKEVGKGTGLGLPICQRIVERLGGALSLDTAVGQGTTVRIDLPARRAAAAPSRAAAPRPRQHAATATEGVF